MKTPQTSNKFGLTQAQINLLSSYAPATAEKVKSGTVDADTLNTVWANIPQQYQLSAIDFGTWKDGAYAISQYIANT